MSYAVGAYLLGTGGLVLLIVFLSRLAPEVGIDQGEPRPIQQALIINLLLMLLWLAQHMGMARPPFKQWLTRFVPPVLERSTYVLATGLTICLIVELWSPMPTVVYAVDSPLTMAFLHTAFWFGWLYALCGIFYDNYFEFNGLEQPYRYVRKQAFNTSSFKVGFVFRLSRRPTFFGILLGCWATPVMTAGHLYFAVLMTLATLLGCYFVERSYLERYGEDYARVQADKPLLLPNPLLAFGTPRSYPGAADSRAD